MVQPAASTMRFNIQLTGYISKQQRRRQNGEERQWNRLEGEIERHTHSFWVIRGGVVNDKDMSWRVKKHESCELYLGGWFMTFSPSVTLCVLSVAIYEFADLLNTQTSPSIVRAVLISGAGGFLTIIIIMAVNFFLPLVNNFTSCDLGRSLGRESRKDV